MSDAAPDATRQGGPPVLVEGAVFEGLLVLPGSGRIDGRVRGEVIATEDVWVGPNGVVEAQLAGHTVVIEGRVEGDVRARSLIELRTGGRVRGGLSAPRLRIADGCVVDGPCEAGPAPDAPGEGSDGDRPSP
jgi:cytoskeletal protein CcmA (bactofilin family)